MQDATSDLLWPHHQRRWRHNQALQALRSTAAWSARAQRRRMLLWLMLALPIWLLGSAGLFMLAAGHADQIKAQFEAAARQRLTVAAGAAEQSQLRILDATATLHRLLSSHQAALQARDSDAEAAITLELSNIQRSGLRSVMQAGTVDATGMVRWSTGTRTLDHQFAEADLFQALRDGAPSPLISAPTRAPDTAQDVVLVLRALRNQAGEFLGVTTITLSVAELAYDLASMPLGPNSHAMVLREDGVILATSEPNGPAQRTLPPDGRLLGALRQHDRGIIDIPRAVLDGRSKLIAFSRILTAPLVVTVGLDREQEFAAIVFGGRAAIAAASGLSLFLLGSILTGIFWYDRRRTRARLERARRQREVMLQRLRDANRDLERRVAERAAELAESNADFRAMFESTAVGMNLVDPNAGVRYLRVNQRFCEITGYSEAELLSSVSSGVLTHPDDMAAWRADYTRQITTTGRYTGERRYIRKDGQVIWIRADVALVAHKGSMPRAVSVVQDVTARKQAEERQALLAREVDHRAKNMLSVVLAAIRMTPEQDLGRYRTALEGRLSALARAHGLLAGTGWNGADLREAAQATLQTFASRPLGSGGASASPGMPRISINGPPLLLTPAAVQALSLALHELATNATKYGALSVPEGMLALSWEIADDTGELKLAWRECGAPAIAAPPRQRGFGTRLIDTSIRAQLGGEVTRDWRSDGLNCVITLPLHRAQTADKDTSRTPDQTAVNPQ